jgi:hypothetical protein
MRIQLARGICFAIACIGMQCTVSAQGRGSGNRGLGMAAGNAAAAAAPGMSNATQAASQVGNGGFGGASAGQFGGRSHGGMPRDLSQVSGVAAGVGRGTSSLSASASSQAAAAQARPRANDLGGNAPENWERIQQHRTQRADQLRTISERNGNSQLLTAADRMEASAVQNFERKQAAAEHAIDEHVADARSAVPAAPTARPVSAPKKGFWFRSR